MQTVDVRTLERFAKDRMHISSVFATEHLRVELFCFDPGTAQRPQEYEDSDMIYFILEGTGRFNIGHTTRELKAGTAVLAPAAVEHCVVNLSDSRLVLLVFMAPAAKIRFKSSDVEGRT